MTLDDREDAPEGATFDFDAVRREMDGEDWTIDPYDRTREVRYVFLGTVGGCYPSGRFYAPWSSNVTEEEADADEAWREAVERELNARGMFFEHSEHDPCNLLAVEWRDRDMNETDETDEDPGPEDGCSPFRND